MNAMTVPQMRYVIHDAYPSSKWKRKVLNMPDDQVIAVYHKLLNSGKLDPKPTKPTTSKQIDIPKFEPFIGSQLSIF